MRRICLTAANRSSTILKDHHGHNRLPISDRQVDKNSWTFSPTQKISGEVGLYKKRTAASSTTRSGTRQDYRNLEQAPKRLGAYSAPLFRDFRTEPQLPEVPGRKRYRAHQTDYRCQATPSLFRKALRGMPGWSNSQIACDRTQECQHPLLSNFDTVFRHREGTLQIRRSGRKQYRRFGQLRSTT